jgi:integrase/recombinase XerD
MPIKAFLALFYIVGIDMNELSQAFQQWLIEEGRSPKMIESYVGDIKGYQQFLNEKAADIDQPLSRFAFVRFKQFLLDENFALATINKKINSLKVYIDFLQFKRIVDENYIQLKRDRVKIAAGSEQVVDALSDEQVDKLLAVLS